MDLKDTMIGRLRDAACATARAEWESDQRLARAAEATEILLETQRRAQAMGIDPATIARAGRAVVVVDARGGGVEVVGADVVQGWHRVLWPGVEVAVEELREVAPTGMDPEVVEERIRVNLVEESGWGGVWLGCTVSELQRDFAEHFVAAVEVWGYAC